MQSRFVESGIALDPEPRLYAAAKITLLFFVQNSDREGVSLDGVRAPRGGSELDGARNTHQCISAAGANHNETGSEVIPWTHSTSPSLYFEDIFGRHDWHEAQRKDYVFSPTDEVF